MAEGIKLIVGLGNPGLQYEQTRHNVGFWLIRSLAQENSGNFKSESKFQGLVSRISLSGHRCELFLPATFMNLSGEAVRKIVQFYKLAARSILVVYDELDFSPGVIRLKQGGGVNGHNGVQSIIDNLDDGDFWRMRIGIGKPKFKDDTSNYVLSSPNKLEQVQIESAVDRGLIVIPDLVLGDFSQAMLGLHTI